MQNYTLSKLQGVIDYFVPIQEKIENILGSLSWFSLGLLYAQERDKNFHACVPLQLILPFHFHLSFISYGTKVIRAACTQRIALFSLWRLMGLTKILSDYFKVLWRYLTKVIPILN